MNNTHEFLNDLGSSDFESWVLVNNAYSYYSQKEDIMECGFNKHSGYVYIALENGISIASCFGQTVEYIVTNYENGDEYFLENYTDALNKIETL
tara:strand:+ start:328 stop:609 length:282 start_codon:yes stop_codon:yes gene_type:complete